MRGFFTSSVLALLLISVFLYSNQSESNLTESSVSEVYLASLADESVRNDLLDNALDTPLESSDTYLFAALIESEASNNNDDEAMVGILGNEFIKIINLGPIVNHEGVDYAPTISADGRTLYYVSNRPGSRIGETGAMEGKLSHDFWAARKAERLDSVFSAPWNIDTLTGLGYLNVNTEYNEGAASIASDRQSLYFTACGRPDGYGSCDIYMSRIEGEQWLRPINLGENINTEAFESMPSISPDGKRLYFISNRRGPNSRGPRDLLKGTDIWYSDWDDRMGDWGPAKNLEALNTSDQESSPFIAADNVTLFFASEGHKPNLGGLDFYITRYDPVTDTWSKPQNLGAPINTPQDEQFITLPAAGDIVYFSSRRKDIVGAQGDLDLYMAYVPTFFRAVNVIVEVIDECSQENIPATLTFKNSLTGRTVTETVSDSRKTAEIIISNPDYGDPRDSVRFIDLDITAENPRYAARTVLQVVEKPDITEDPSRAKVPDEIKLTISLGQRPVLSADIAESEFVRQAKIRSPELSSFRGLVMEQVQTWDLYPLLNYVFFEAGQSTFPERYQIFTRPEQTRIFSDTTIRGGTLDKYYHILNIYGFRLTKFPNAKISIVGTVDGDTPSEKDINLAERRAQLVYDYFVNIWNISPDRLKLEKRPKPDLPTSTRIDSIGYQENRRVEIRTDEWEIIKPVFDRGSITIPQPEEMNFVMNNGIEDNLVQSRRIEINRGERVWQVLSDIGTVDERFEWDWYSREDDLPADEVPFTARLVLTTNTGHECASDPIVIPVMQVSTERKRVESTADSTRERYNLILFPFDSDLAGPLNERIMRDYVYERCRPSSVIEVIGHTDIVGMFDHNKRLSERRSETVRTGIMRQTGGRFHSLNSKGVGEEDPLYTNDFPEGRFYNRTVQVRVRTPLTEYDNE